MVDNGAEDLGASLQNALEIRTEAMFVADEARRRIREALGSPYRADPILQHWARESRAPVPDYPGGSMGPAEADVLIERDGRQWRN